MGRFETPVAAAWPAELGMIERRLPGNHFFGVGQTPIAADLGVAQDAARFGMIGVFVKDFIQKLIGASRVLLGNFLRLGEKCRRLLPAQLEKLLMPLLDRFWCAPFWR